eukprot:jgi/Hompol1/5556/HPOL_004539-RA
MSDDAAEVPAIIVDTQSSNPALVQPAELSLHERLLAWREDVLQPNTKPQKQPASTDTNNQLFDASDDIQDNLMPAGVSLLMKLVRPAPTTRSAQDEMLVQVWDQAADDLDGLDNLDDLDDLDGFDAACNQPVVATKTAKPHSYELKNDTREQVVSSVNTLFLSGIEGPIGDADSNHGSFGESQEVPTTQVTLDAPVTASHDLLSASSTPFQAQMLLS